MIDFTLNVYRELLQTFRENHYRFFTVEDYLSKSDDSNEKLLIMRHDVDRLPNNALNMALTENKLGVETTYYFRSVPESYDEGIISEIIELGHEIGYHYENLSILKGNLDQAIKDFEDNLNQFRELVPIKTICMHGSPLSPWDNRDIWKEYDYRDFGIIGEPYLDIDFENVYYITDTGRRWDGKNVSVRDKVNVGGSEVENYYHSTHDIIASVEEGSFPERVMMNVHPQRWTNNPFLWTKELIMQNIKNVGKYILIKLRNI